MPLPAVPLDSSNEKQHRTMIATVLNELVKHYQQSDSWTPVISGAGTAGTYEIATNQSRYTRIGRRVFLDVDIVLAAAITGGGAGNLQITGVPYGKMDATLPQGSVRLNGVDYAASASLSIQWNASSGATALLIAETNDNAATTFTQISGVAANDRIAGSISYETDDP